MYHLQVLKSTKDSVTQKAIEASAFQTILEALLANGISIRHDCGGVCHCTTCHVYVEKGSEHIDEPSNREKAFLKCCADVRPVSRLACQCLLKEGRGSLEISIPVQKEQ